MYFLLIYNNSINKFQTYVFSANAQFTSYLYFKRIIKTWFWVSETFCPCETVFTYSLAAEFPVLTGLSIKVV